VQVISYDGWDDAYTQYRYKYEYYGRTLPQDFLDAETSDFYNWRMPGSGWYSQTSVVGTTGKIYWMEAYSFNETEIVKALRRTINGDTEAPYCHSANPAPNATNVSVNTNISVNVKDDGSGVDRDSVKMVVMVPGDAVVPGNLDISGNFLDFHLTFDPNSSLPPNTKVTVTVDAKDLFGNAMQSYQWQFTTGALTVTPTSFGKVKAAFY
jgi:hypothetical protein